MRRWNSRTVRVGASVLGLMLLTVLMASCGGTKTTTTASVADDTATTAPMAPTKLTLILPNPAPIPWYEAYVANSQGFFAKRNLTVEIVAVEGGDATLTAFAAGQADIASIDSSVFLRAAGSKPEFKPVMFYLMTNSGNFDIVVPEDSPIKTLADLNGKVVAANTEQDGGAILIDSVNKQLGITIKKLFCGDPMQALAGFQRNDIVAYACVTTDIATLKAQGFALRGLLTPEMKAASGSLAYWAKRETVTAKPEALKAFAAALQEARAYIGDDPQKLIDWMNAQNPITADNMGFIKAMASIYIQLRPTDVTPVGSIPPASFQLQWDNLLSQGVVKGQATDFYTNEFFAQ
jgi:NitT/TauT family transport system substrate-binding protein